MRLRLASAVVLTVTLSVVALASAEEPAAPGLRFETQELDKTLGVGYAVLLVDVNHDTKPDIVVVDQTKVVWYENPTWKKRSILEGKTRADNVCLAAHDIDGDGKVDFALGADWKPFNTKTGGTLHWLRRGKSLDEPWELYDIGEEPTVHRIRFIDTDGSGKPKLVVGPLMGQGATKENNWTDGRPLRLLAYTIPKDPAKDRWVPDVIDQSLHVMHNFAAVPGRGKGHDVLTASYEGVHLFTNDDGKWTKQHLGTGNQDNPKGNRGASEIKQGSLKGRAPFIATVEPWHGHQIVTYTPPEKAGLWQRHLLDDKLKWGHAVSCVDLDGDGADELVIGVRDNLSANPGEKCGVRIYTATDGVGAKWARQLVDEGGVAVEDLACGDLDGDGKPDIVAVGRATKNLRIYWNKGKK